jgi:flagellar export protein FliJ
MAFHFPLETVLRFRRSQERQQELLLEEANHRVNLVRQAIDELDRYLAELTACLDRQLNSGVTAAEIQFDQLRRSLLHHRRREMEKEMAQRMHERRQCLEALQKARQQREVVDTLRRHQMQLYRQQENRQQQRRLDDLFLLRREFLRRRLVAGRTPALPYSADE